VIERRVLGMAAVNPPGREEIDREAPGERTLYIGAAE
jgi:hypothetical protein